MDNKITTSLESIVQGLPNNTLRYYWSTGSDSESVGAPANGLAFAYIVRKINTDTAVIIADPLRAENSKYINTVNTQELVETVLSFPSGGIALVRFSGEAGTTIAENGSLNIGVAVKADANTVDLLVGSYANGKVLVCRVARQSVGNYTATRKSVILS